MAIGLSRSIRHFLVLFCFSLGLSLPGQLLAMDGSRWSYDDDYSSTADRYSDSKSTFNPWTGNRNGPSTTSPDEQFNYGREGRIQPPPRLEDLYPKPGSNARSRRPWGDVPYQFREPDHNSYPWYDEKRHYQPQKQSQYWSDLESRNKEWYDDQQFGGYDDQYSPLYNDLGAGYGSWQKNYGDQYRSGYPRYNDSGAGYGGWRSYDDQFRSFSGPLYNDYGSNYGGWQRYNPFSGSSPFRDNQYFPRFNGW